MPARFDLVCAHSDKLLNGGDLVRIALIQVFVDWDAVHRLTLLGSLELCQYFLGMVPDKLMYLTLRDKANLMFRGMNIDIHTLRIQL